MYMYVCILAAHESYNTGEYEKRKKVRNTKKPKL